VANSYFLRPYHSFLGGNLVKFSTLKKMILTYPKDLSWKIWLIFTRFQRKNKSKSPEFYDEFQQVAKDIEGF